MIFNNFGFNRQAVAGSSSPPIPVPASAVLALDAGDPASYPGTGNIWTDLSTSGNNATFGSGMSYSTTGNANGGFLNLVGNASSTGSFVNPTNIPSGNSSYTTTTWLKVASNTTFNGWLGWGTNGTDSANSYRFTITSPNNLIQNYWYSVTDFNVPFTPVVGSWYFIAYTWNGSTANLLIRGAATTGSVLSHGAVNVTPTSNLRVGGDTLNNPINGSLAFLRINNVALTSTEILALYDATKARYGF